MEKAQNVSVLSSQKINSRKRILLSSIIALSTVVCYSGVPLNSASALDFVPVLSQESEVLRIKDDLKEINPPSGIPLAFWYSYIDGLQISSMYSVVEDVRPGSSAYYTTFTTQEVLSEDSLLSKNYGVKLNAYELELGASIVSDQSTSVQLKSELKAYEDVPSGYTQTTWNSFVDGLTFSSSYSLTKDVEVGSPDYYTTISIDGYSETGTTETVYGLELDSDSGQFSSIDELAKDLLIRQVNEYSIVAGDRGNFDFTINGVVYSASATDDFSLTRKNNLAADIARNSGTFFGLITDNSGGAVAHNKTIDLDIFADFIGNSAYSTTRTSLSGGAINNIAPGALDSVEGNYIANSVISEANSANVAGGAIMNGSSSDTENALIARITGDYIANLAKAEGTNSVASGGAIYNGLADSIYTIDGDFIGNQAFTLNNSYGGAIYNAGEMSSILSDFIFNSATGMATVQGGAIYNASTASIDAIIGDFIGNSVDGGTSTTAVVSGAAIYNEGVITNIIGDMIGNTANSLADIVGGIVYNKNSIDSITGSFISNSVTTANGFDGGIIMNEENANIGSISGDFINNSFVSTAESSAARSYGSVLYNDTYATIDSVSGNFIGNSSDTGEWTLGGVIYNNGFISIVSGNFIDNSTTYGYGGAIFNYSDIDLIMGNFIGNRIVSIDEGGDARGGAIGTLKGSFNGASHTMGLISGQFYENYVVALDGVATGGAIYNSHTVDSLVGDFVGNYSMGKYAFGGALANSGVGYIESIDGDFINNYVLKTDHEQTGTTLFGGALHNEGKIGVINGNFIGNGMKASETGYYSSYGGGIANELSIDVINGHFIGNYIETDVFGWATGGGYWGNYGNSNGVLNTLNGDFIGNYIKTTAANSTAQGAGIFLSDTIGTLNSNFIQNYIDGDNVTIYGGAIYSDGVIDEINGDFYGNYLKSSKNGYGGAIANYLTGSKIQTINGNFYGNFINLSVNEFSSNQYAYGGAIMNSASASFDSITGDFIGNYLKLNSDNMGSRAYGGAIYNSGTSTVIGSINGDFINNYIEINKGTVQGGAIYNSGVLSSITGDFIGNSVLSSELTARGAAIYNESTGNITLKAVGKDILFMDNYATDNTGTRSEAIFNTGVINFESDAGYGIVTHDAFNGVGTYNLVSGGLSLFGPNANFESTAKLNMSDGTFLSTMDGVIRETSLGTATITGAVNYAMDIDLNNKESDVLTATADLTSGSIVISDINIIGNNTNETIVNVTNGLGIDFDFSRTTATGSNNTFAYDYVIDSSMLDVDGTVKFNGSVSGFEKLAFATGAANQAYVQTLASVVDKVTKPMEKTISLYGGNGQESKNPFASTWVEISGTAENLESTELTVDNTSYSALVGADFGGKSSLNSGGNWDSTYSAYLGYFKSTQEYSDITLDQTGTIAGASALFARGNFYNSAAAYLGFNMIDEKNPAGESNYNMYSLSIANEAGFDFAINDKYSIVPNVSAGYHFVSTSDYTNIDNVQIESDALHVLFVTPELKMMMELEKMKSFVLIGYNKNMNLGGQATADSIVLPNLVIEDYAYIGLGAEGNITQSLKGYADAKITTGEKQGISGQIGIKWVF